MLFMPVCILAVSFIIGLLLNKLVRRRIANHLTIEEDTLQYVLIHALRGLPLAWCLGIGLYWMINSLDIAAPIKHLLSYILFTIIVFTITRVAARTLAGMIDIRTQRSADLPKTSLLTNIVNIVIYAMGLLIIACCAMLAPARKESQAR